MFKVVAANPTNSLRRGCLSLLLSQVAQFSSANSLDFIYRHSYNEGPFLAYKTGRLSGLYRHDPRQEGAILELQSLYDRLKRTAVHSAPKSGLTVLGSVQKSGNTVGKPNWFSGIATLMKPRVNGYSENPQRVLVGEKTVRGLYMHGGVGVGKTMLMDLLVAAKPPKVKVMRNHFHDFMLGIQAKHNSAPGDRVIESIAESISSEANLLALDELFVSDIGNAMIVTRLFKFLWESGVVVVATSNQKPDDLYSNGLNRSLFLPFIDNLKEMCVVYDMDSAVDYRKLAQYHKGVYFTGEQRNRCLQAAFNQKSMGDFKKKDAEISLKLGRKLRVPVSAGSLCYFTFDELCGRPVGSSDYIGLCQSYHTVFIQDIPKMSVYNVSAAYRFVTLIDILYDNRIRVVCSAETDIDGIFSSVVSHSQLIDKDSKQLIVDDRLAASKDRTISRLIEMRSKKYLVDHANKHAPELLLALAEQEHQSDLSVASM